MTINKDSVIAMDSAACQSFNTFQNFHHHDPCVPCPDDHRELVIFCLTEAVMVLTVPRQDDHGKTLS